MTGSKFVQFRRWLVRWIENPWVDLVIGVFVMITAIFEFTMEEVHHLNGAKGLFLLGGWVIIKASLRLLESLDLILDSAENYYQQDKPLWLQKCGFTFLIHILIALLLVFIGISEAFDEFYHETEAGQVWHLNLILIGAMIIIKTFGELMDAIYFATKAAKKTMHQGAQRMISWLRFPKLELTMAFMVLFISAWEHLIRPELQTEAFSQLGPHHGVALYALVHITRFFASMAETADLVYLSNSESQPNGGQ